MSSVQVKLEQLEIGYRRGLLPPFSMKITSGQFWGVVGPNGAGKSTLVKTILGILKPVSGKRVVKTGVKMGYVPQQNQFSDQFPLSVYDVVVMGRYHLKKRENDREIIDQAIDIMGIDQLRDKQFSDLSGGQKQRTLIARALAGEPDLLILDEPTSGMDLVGTEEMIRFLKKWQQQGERTVMMITHILSQMINDVTDLCLINHHQKQFLTGEIEAILTPDHLSRIYNVPLSIEIVSGKRYVFTGGGDV